MEIIIKENVSYKNLPILKKIHRDDWTLKEVNITYSPSKGLPSENDTDKYPVKIFFEDKEGEIIVVKIFTLTAGYSGSGPSDLAELLDWLKVKYQEDEIFTKKCVGEDGYIRLNY